MDEMKCPYVTVNDCARYRNDMCSRSEKFEEKGDAHDIAIAVMQAQVATNIKLNWAILATLISGFVGTIFAVLTGSLS